MSVFNATGTFPEHQTSYFDGCTESCGWIAAVVSVVAFGTFGVPLKTNPKPGIVVHPLVMQSYKTFTCFVTSWCVLLLGEPFKFTKWGILSGLFWVPGAACGIYGIRNAGLAVAVGTWSSITVLTSFVFGILIFQEGVKSIAHTALAFILLILGLIGMSRYSSMKCPPPANNSRRGTPSRSNSRKMDNDSLNDLSFSNSSSDDRKIIPLEVESLIDDEDKIMKGYMENMDRIAVCGKLSLSRRQTGILGAVINGAWGGLNLIPLHYAKLSDPTLTGAGYLISYAIGSVIVNVALWVLWFFYEYSQSVTVAAAVDRLPKFHFDFLLVPGLSAGTLYSIGNFGSILAVAYLGQGTGFSFCMMQLFVSGLWGVFYFREIRGFEIISKWFVSAGVAVIGIIWLSYEHEGSSIGHR